MTVPQVCVWSSVAVGRLLLSPEHQSAPILLGKGGVGVNIWNLVYLSSVEISNVDSMENCSILGWEWFVFRVLKAYSFGLLGTWNLSHSLCLDCCFLSESLWNLSFFLIVLKFHSHAWNRCGFFHSKDSLSCYCSGSSLFLGILFSFSCLTVYFPYTFCIDLFI